MAEQGVPGPAVIMQLMQAHHASAALFAGVRLGAFGALADGARSAGEVAARIECPERTTRILLDALAVVGLLQKSGGRYALTPPAADHLVPGKPMYLGDTAGIFDSEPMWSGLPRLADAVRAGGSVLPEHAETPSHPFWEGFAQWSASMSFAGAMQLEALLKPFVASRPRVRVLDVAAGSGIYGLTLARAANVELTLLDWPNVLEKTRGWAQRLSADAARVKYLAGNLFEVAWGEHDVILLSHVFHHFDPPTCAALMQKAASACAPGGRVVVHDFLYDPELRNPAAAMFSVTMLNWTRHGQAFALDDYAGWMRGAGLKGSEVAPSQALPTTFLVASK